MICSLKRCNKPAHNLSKVRCIRHCAGTACFDPNCGKTPTFNYPTAKKGLYCACHKVDGMVNLRAKKCIYVDCNKSPSYNNPGEIGALYCSGHKIKGMINVRTKECQYPGCNADPILDQRGRRKHCFCTQHKLGMICNS